MDVSDLKREDLVVGGAWREVHEAAFEPTGLANKEKVKAFCDRVRQLDPTIDAVLALADREDSNLREAYAELTAAGRLVAWGLFSDSHPWTQVRGVVDNVDNWRKMKYVHAAVVDLLLASFGVTVDRHAVPKL